MLMEAAAVLRREGTPVNVTVPLHTIVNRRDMIVQGDAAQHHACAVRAPIFQEVAIRARYLLTLGPIVTAEVHLEVILSCRPIVTAIVHTSILLRERNSVHYEREQRMSDVMRRTSARVHGS